MFICDECLNENYENESSFMRSYGRCEICKKSAACNDIYSGSLVRKKK